MKAFKYIILLTGVAVCGCKKTIDLYPQSNLNTATYYSNTSEVNTALTGCYNAMQKPMLEEWTLTELRSDNSIQGVAGSTSTPNRDLSYLDMFFPSTSHAGNYNYWLSTYYNIRNLNIVLNSLGVNYNEAPGTNTYANGPTAKFAQIPATDLGRANSWSAKALLAKVYLTLNRKTDAATLLQDIITNSGYSLQASYANVFSITTEMNSEILFNVRYKAGGIGLGSTFANSFAPLNSGSAVVNGDGLGLNYPTAELNNLYTATDARKAVNIAVFGSGSSAKL